LSHGHLAPSSSFEWKKTVFQGSFVFRETSPMKSGNLLLTQPNEVFTRRLLVETTPQGEFVQSFSLPISLNLYVQPIDLAFHPVSKSLYLLDFLKGVYQVDTNGTVKGIFGEAVGNHTMGCSLEAITWDKTGDYLYVLDIDTTCIGYPDRIPGVHKFDASGKYLGITITRPSITSPDGFALDENGIFWFTDNSQNVVVKKIGSDGKVLGMYSYPQLNAKILNRVKSIGGGTSQNIWVTSISPDTIFLLDSDGNMVSRISMQGDASAPSGTPSGLAIDSSTGNVFVENSDSYMAGLLTQRVQVYKKDGTYLYGFGGTGCGASDDNYLCQTFDGVEFIP